MSKYFTLVINTGEGWEDVFGDYSAKACREEFAYSYNEYSHPHFDRTWRTSDSKVVCTDGTEADLIACLAHMNREVAA